MNIVDDLTRRMTAEKERADYAWRNTRTIEAARQEEMSKRVAAEKDAARYRWLRDIAYHATAGPNGKMVWCVTGEGCSTEEPIFGDALDAAIDATLNVELTGAAQPDRAASSNRRERG